MRRPVISIEMQVPGVWYRPTIDGVGVGPGVDEKSAKFLMEWLDLAITGLDRMALEAKVDRTLMEAIFGRGHRALDSPAAEVPALDSAAVDAPAIEQEEAA